jgi:RNA polymerase sigma-70 factor (ECF subfamily)
VIEAAPGNAAGAGCVNRVKDAVDGAATRRNDGSDMRRPGSEADWSDWMRAALAGDAAAYRRVLEALSPVLRAMAARGLARAGAGSGDIEDVVQETLLALHLKRHTWDPAQPLMPWVAAIARHKLIDGLRRRGRRVEVSVDDLHDILAAPPERDPTEARDVDRLLGRLAPRQRDIVRSITVEARSIAATAVLFGMSEGAVRVALHRGLKALADLSGSTL